MRDVFLLGMFFLLVASTTVLFGEEQKEVVEVPRTVSIVKEAEKEESAEKVFELKGSVKILGEEETVPEFRIYFDGMETFNNEEGFFSFPLEEGKIQKYSIVVCKNVHQNFEKTNTLDSLSIFKGAKYKYFSLKQTGTGDTDWNCKEKALERKNFVLPRNCIVILVDPKYVDHIEHWKPVLSENFVKLPRIFLKEGIRPKLNRASAKSLLYSLDSKPFHETIREKKKVMLHGKGHVSLVQ